jgi:hypothetical protein
MNKGGCVSWPVREDLCPPGALRRPVADKARKWRTLTKPGGRRPATYRAGMLREVGSAGQLVRRDTVRSCCDTSSPGAVSAADWPWRAGALGLPGD